MKRILLFFFIIILTVETNALLNNSEKSDNSKEQTGAWSKVIEASKKKKKGGTKLPIDMMDELTPGERDKYLAAILLGNEKVIKKLVKSHPQNAEAEVPSINN